MDLNITPPDNAVFEKKASTKQKEHLARARLKAKETIARRRQLDIEANLKAGEKDEDKEEDKEEENVIVEQESEAPKKKREIKAKKVELTDEEKELKRFEKFMHNMKLYEDAKLEEAYEREEAKKIKCSFTQEEYDYLMKRCEDDKPTPVLPKSKSAPPKPKPLKMSMTSRDKISKFGR